MASPSLSSSKLNKLIRTSLGPRQTVAVEAYSATPGYDLNSRWESIVWADGFCFCFSYSQSRIATLANPTVCQSVTYNEVLLHSLFIHPFDWFGLIEGYKGLQSWRDQT